MRPRDFAILATLAVTPGCYSAETVGSCSAPAGHYTVTYTEVSGTCGAAFDNELDIGLGTPARRPDATDKYYMPHIEDFADVTRGFNPVLCLGTDTTANSTDLVCDTSASLVCQNEAGAQFTYEEDWDVSWSYDASEGFGTVVVTTMWGADEWCSSTYHVEIGRR